MKVNWNKITIKELAGIVNNALEKSNMEAVLVGGSCVSIYSKNMYVSQDLDFITYSTIKQIIPVLKDLGFEKTGSLQFEHPDCKYYIEFLSPPVSLGEESPITDFNIIKTKMGTIILLTPTDCIKDRLAAYFHWNDPQSLEQALLVAKNNKINTSEIKRWSVKEGELEKFNIFRKKLNM